MNGTDYRIAVDDYGNIRHCENCGSLAPTYLFPSTTIRGNTRLCEICANTHLERSLKTQIETSNDDIAKGLAWCVNLLRAEIAQLRTEIAEMKNKKP